MAHLLRIFVAVLVALTGLSLAHAQTPEPRIALVIGNSAYRAGSLATPANDAGLVAQTLTQAGFDVIGARDLDQDGLRRSFRDFIEKAAASGPDTIAFVYLAGYGLQYAGENYFAPVDASILRDSSVPVEALRISDFTRALADLPLKARIVVLDAARANPFAPTGQPLAGGLALVDPEPESLIAFNAAPGTIPPQATGDYGPYAKALAEMMQEGGLGQEEVFARTRLRVSDATRGAQTPWSASRLTRPVIFFERAADAPPAVAEAPRSRAVRDLPVADAYALALERDTIASYQEFLQAYPRDPLSPRVEAMLAARREALTWRRAVVQNTPAAYWTYLRRYPRGPHVADAHRRLAILSAALEPPAVFEEYVFDVPPPPEVEYVYVSGPVVYFDDAYYAPPPPPPIYFLPPPPREYIDLPPPRFSSPGFLPVPIPVFLPSARPWRSDVYRQPPPVRLPAGVTPRDPGAPPRFIAPAPTNTNPLRPQPNVAQPRVQPPLQQSVQPGIRTPSVSPQQTAPLLSQPQPLQQPVQQQQSRQQQREFQRQQLRAQQIQQQRDQQMRLQQQRGLQVQRQREEQFRIQQQREQQLRTRDAQRREQQLRAQQFQQQREQQMRGQQFQQQREQQLRGQQLQQQREQQLRARQFQQQREQQLRGQQLQQQREQQLRGQQLQQQREQQMRAQQFQQQRQQQMQQQQMQQQQRAQQQQQQMQRVQQQQQQQIQMQMQRAQQQQQQQQRQQQQQQQRQQRTDCGTPGKPPCR